MSATLSAVGVKLAKAAGKRAAQKAAKQTAGKITKSGKPGKSKKRKKVRNWETTLILAFLTVLALISGVITGGGLVYATIAVLVPGKASSCLVSKDAGPSEGNGNSGSTDGTGGSNIPFPTESATKVYWPLTNGKSMISSHMGWRAIPNGTLDFFGTGKMYHNGTDYGAPEGTPVLAMADGIVAQAGPNSYGYGTVVTIHHMINGKKYSTTYGHVQRASLKVSVGDKVTGGQQIAGVGQEGNSQGAHLHFVLTDGVYSDYSEMNNLGPQNNIDPVAFLESNGAISGSSQESAGSQPGVVLPNGCKSSSDSTTLENLDDYQKYASEKLKERGLGGTSQTACLIAMWNKESGWDPKAANPSSSARGIPQMMMNLHFGEDWETNEKGRAYLDNPQKQIDVGLNYIEERYETPCKAWAIWQEQEWY